MACESQTQHTLAGEVELAGIGVHSGRPTRLRVLPGQADSGLRFRRIDLPGAPEIPATLDYVQTSQMNRRTSVGLDASVLVSTVEHLLAVCFALGVDNAVFEADGEEMPFLDGSAGPIARACTERGLVEQDRPRRSYDLKSPVIFNRYPVQIIALPLESLRVTYFLEFDNAVIRTQAGHFEITPQVFLTELAPARTFCFERDVARLQAQGLIRGGSLDCAVVIGEDRILNDSLRFPDELVRHKVVDLLGDLCLLGKPLRAHISAWRAGHSWHVEFLKNLREALCS
ncbi:UDP-3-O-[3-hydroxymyristoyl] N-acetylglucosamine deacetylase [Candidatus Sumerlaeota bacterium]|nr:UDP-3-O-[3-hydroxymyristoyl] N-acetylglucosamine deacetylase [Candidatus Sumerlaeota bacterium]